MVDAAGFILGENSDSRCDSGKDGNVSDADPVNRTSSQCGRPLRFCGGKINQEGCAVSLTHLCIFHHDVLKKSIPDDCMVTVVNRNNRLVEIVQNCDIAKGDVFNRFRTRFISDLTALCKVGPQNASVKRDIARVAVISLYDETVIP